MPRIVRRLRITAVVFATGLLLIAPAARASGHVDLRTPDARAAATGQQASDLRSPDARDAATAPAPAAQSSSSGIDWTQAGIGAGTAVVLLIGVGGTVLVARRRHAVVPS